jgi:DNA-binding CsgD family transcriptional regulator
MSADLPRVAPLARALLLQLGWSSIGYANDETRFEVTIDRKLGRGRLFRLSSREHAVIALTARGLSSKEVGAVLSIAPPTSRGALERAVTKLHLSGAGQVPAFWAALGSHCSRSELAGGGERFIFRWHLPDLVLPELSPCEHALAVGVLMGYANSEIARQRDVSPRTVANQLHSAFRKLRVSSRTELAALLLRSLPSRRDGDGAGYSTNSPFTGNT